jgi:hypothetical protein
MNGEPSHLEIHDSQKIDHIKPRWMYSDPKSDTFTEDFAQWNAGNKLVYEGKPLRWFHGTNDVFDFFQTEHILEVGFHFGSAPQAVGFNWTIWNEYPNYNKSDQKDHVRPRTYTVVICLKNPLEIEEPATWDFKNKKLEVDNPIPGEGDYPFITTLTDALRETPFGQQFKLKKELRSHILKRCKTNDDVRLFLIELGFDGITYLNISFRPDDQIHHSVIAFHPNQVRSFFDGSYIWKDED